MGNDFAYGPVQGKSDGPQVGYSVLDMVYYLLRNHGEEDLGVPIDVKIATASEYFEEVEKLE